jgi:hypothetical protein
MIISWLVLERGIQIHLLFIEAPRRSALLFPGNIADELVWIIHFHGHFFLGLDAVPNNELGQISLTVMQNNPMAVSLSRVKLKFWDARSCATSGGTR